MESHVKFLGHPIHPMLIVFPFGLLSMAFIFDVAYVLSGERGLATFSFWALVAGLIGGLCAAVFGFVDRLAIPPETRAKRIGAMHGIGNLVVVSLFAIGLILRWPHPAYLPDVTTMVPTLLGTLLALFTAWLGGELVYRLRVGVDEGADLDASKSMQAERHSHAGR